MYHKPGVNIIVFNANDVITSSSNDNVGAGRADWAGWSAENDGGVWGE